MYSHERRDPYNLDCQILILNPSPEEFLRLT